MGSIFPIDVDAVETLAKAIAREVVHELQATMTVASCLDERAERTVFEVGPLTINTQRHETTVDGNLIDLQPREFALIAALARNAGHVLSRATLIELAWPQDKVLSLDNERTVDVHIRRLRFKLGVRSDRLLTIKGVGYKLNDR